MGVTAANYRIRPGLPPPGTLLGLVVEISALKWVRLPSEYLFYLFIPVVKPSILIRANLITVLAKNPHGEKTRKEGSVLDVGGKPQRIISGKAHTIR